MPLQESPDSTDRAFRRRALTEAARYGSDSWVFIRELLQNARDAGAQSVAFDVTRSATGVVIACRDDGRGMSYAHAQRYLFALYASSKDHNAAEAGKFGVGFWSVLRFEPSCVTIRSRAAGETAWQVKLTGDLDDATVSEIDEPSGDRSVGTEVVLERDGEAEGLESRVLAAAQRYGRFLGCRDAPERPLEISVNGRSANAEFSLPAPSASFEGKGFRGVVGLGAEPSVELFAQGLFVRSANSLQELQEIDDLPGRSTQAEDALAELPKLAPQVLIDSSEIDLLLARSDVRHDAHLRRCLKTAEKALGRLITRQLQALRPQPWYRTWLGLLQDRLEPVMGWRLVAAALAGLVLGSIAFWWLPVESGFSGGQGTRASLQDGAGQAEPSQPPIPSRVAATIREDGTSEGAAAPSSGGTAPASGRALSGSGPTPPAASGSAQASTGSLGAGAGLGAAAGGRGLNPYSDLAASYSGPRPSRLLSDQSRTTLVYEPTTETPFFTALVVDDLGDASWVASPLPNELPPYRGNLCRRDCLDIRLLVAGGGALRIPIPTGHRLDTTSVRLDGGRVAVFETPQGEALLRPPTRGPSVLDYRTGPTTGTASSEPVYAAPSARLARFARGLQQLPIDQRVQRGLDFVAESITYDRSASVARAYRPLMEEGASLVDAALEIGAGDCDVQNGALVMLLRAAGVDARLALGYVGNGGTVAPGLHAWVEYADGQGQWQVADASLTSDPSLLRPPIDSGAAVAGLSDPIQTPGRLAATSAPDGWRGSIWSSRTAIPALLALLGATAWMLRSRRGSAAIELDDGQDLAALLGGALRHPGAFAGMPAVFYGRFVPLVEGGAISLRQANRLAEDNRLFRSSVGSPLALEARRKVPVIDAATAEGRVSSLALGAIDLDHWSKLLERSSQPALCQQINRSLAKLRAPWRLRQVEDLPTPWVEVALENLGLGQRQVMIDTKHLEFAPAKQLLPQRPAAAAFTLLDVLLRRLDLEEQERARLLAAFASEAVQETSSEEIR